MTTGKSIALTRQTFVGKVMPLLFNTLSRFVIAFLPRSTGTYSYSGEDGQEKEKWLSGEALQIAVKRREVKSKGENERYKHLNAEFQRVARRDKKAFFSVNAMK